MDHSDQYSSSTHTHTHTHKHWGCIYKKNSHFSNKHTRPPFFHSFISLWPSSHLISSLLFSGFLLSLSSFPYFFLLSSFFNVYLSLHTSDPHLRMVFFHPFHLYPSLPPPSSFTSILWWILLIYLFLYSIHAAAGCSWIIRMSYKERRSLCWRIHAHTHSYKYTPFTDCLSSNLSIIISCHLLNRHSNPSHKLYNRERWRKNSLCRQVSEWNRGLNGPWTKYLVRKTKQKQT